MATVETPAAPEFVRDVHLAAISDQLTPEQLEKMRKVARRHKVNFPQAKQELEEMGLTRAAGAFGLIMQATACTDEDEKQRLLETALWDLGQAKPTLREQLSPQTVAALDMAAEHATKALLGIMVDRVNLSNRLFKEAGEARQKRNTLAFDGCRNRSREAMKNAREIDFPVVAMKAIERLLISCPLLQLVGGLSVDRAVIMDAPEGRRASALLRAITQPPKHEYVLKPASNGHVEKRSDGPKLTPVEKAQRDKDRRDRQLERAKACRAMRGSNPGVQKFGKGKKGGKKGGK